MGPPMATSELAGQVAAVTGAGSGIGRGIALALAAEGASIAILDRNEKAANETSALVTRAGGKTVSIVCDVSSEESIARAEAAAHSALGPVQILVNNAGLLQPGLLSELTLAQWNAVIAVDLTGYFLCAKAFGVRMRQAGKGSLIHIGSVAATFAQTRGGAYSAAKAGVIGLSATLAAEWGPDGVRSNVVHPGMIRTPLTEAFYQDPSLIKRREATIASRRTGLPTDVAQVVAFLASDRASYINGAELTVDGGFSRMALDLVPRPGYDRQ
jgi:glucose 1-dehydrogenase